MSWSSHYSDRVKHITHVYSDVSVNKPTTLSVVEKYSTQNYEQCIILDNGNKWLCYWLMCSLCYAFYP